MSVPAPGPGGWVNPLGKGLAIFATKVCPPSSDDTTFVFWKKPYWRESCSRVPVEPKYVPHPPRITVFSSMLYANPRRGMIPRLKGLDQERGWSRGLGR